MKHLSFFFLLTLLACSTPRATQGTADVPGLTDADRDRVATARARLSTSDPAKKVLRAIDAMGGLARWYANGPLYYHFDYQPLDGSNPRNTLITNDYRRARAVHQLASDPSIAYGFDGSEAWSPDGGKVEGMSPRFWSLTPYYFVGLPFVLADEGINFEALPEAQMDGSSYDLVKVTYDAGTGDASDDYYILYLDRASGELDALRYVVTYPGFFPDGGSTDEKLMKITGKTTVEGITLPTGYLTHMWNGGEVSEPVTEITVSDYAYKPDLGEDFFEMPAGAQVYSDLPSN